MSLGSDYTLGGFSCSSSSVQWIFLSDVSTEIISIPTLTSLEAGGSGKQLGELWAHQAVILAGCVSSWFSDKLILLLEMKNEMPRKPQPQCLHNCEVSIFWVSGCLLAILYKEGWAGCLPWVLFVGSEGGKKIVVLNCHGHISYRSGGESGSLRICWDHLRASWFWAHELSSQFGPLWSGDVWEGRSSGSLGG